MSKKSKATKARERRPPDPVGEGMTIEAIVAQLASLKDSSRSFISGDGTDAIWEADVRACDAATDILTALQEEGIRDPEQVRDLIADYNALAKQYQELHRKFEAGDKPHRLGDAYLCPECHRQSRPGKNHCWNCGRKLDWTIGGKPT